MTQENTAHSRRKARMAALQYLYARDVAGNQSETTLDWLMEENPLSNREREFAQQLIEGVEERQGELDEVISQYAPAWPVAQLSAIDRNILRIALFELKFYQETPGKTAINEAVELAKIFGSESSARFVNGVLGSAASDLKLGELAPTGV